jgi:hypothetical protein
MDFQILKRHHAISEYKESLKNEGIGKAFLRKTKNMATLKLTQYGNNRKD